jgi:hypothetical protein
MKRWSNRSNARERRRLMRQDELRMLVLVYELGEGQAGKQIHENLIAQHWERIRDMTEEQFRAYQKSVYERYPLPQPTVH